MKKTFCIIYSILLITSFAFTAQGQDPDGWTDEEAVESANASDELDVSRPKMFSATKCIGKSKNSYVVKRYLMIEYPWSMIQNATLEVRIVGSKAEEQPQFCKPVYFKSIYEKLERIDKDIFNKKMGNPLFRADIEYPRSLFHEYGLPEPENMELSTIMPVAGARADYFYMVLKNPETNELETTFIFHDLSQWAVDNGRLALEFRGRPVMNAEGRKVKEIEFEKPCKIMIWLLHDDYVVWEETFQWPGTKKDAPQKGANKKPNPKVDDGDEEDPRESAKKMENENKVKKNDEQPEKAPEADDAQEELDFNGFGEDF